MKHFSRGIVLKALLIAVSVAVMGMIAGCTSGLAEPFDLNNLFFEYDTVSGSDGEYIIITKHIASQSDVKIPDAIYGIPVREVADSVFAGDNMIKTVTFGKNMRYIRSNAFGNCPHLQSVTFNVSMSDIGDYAFKDCAALSSVSLPKNIDSVGRGAFYGCKALSEVTVPDTIASVGGRAFADTAWLDAQSQEAFVTVGDGILIAYNGGKTAVKLPKEIRQISGAFAGNATVESVALKNEIVSIGDMAFMGSSSLRSVNIPSTVTSIGSNAFYGCTSLEKIIIGENVKSIGSDTFTNCTAAIYVKKGSYAEQYCTQNGLDYLLAK